MTDRNPMVGQRIVVTGMAGAGKSTFSRVLSTKTGVPVICLDLHSWNPGWVRVPEGERADTLVILAMPWWICAWRAFRRGLHQCRRQFFTSRNN